ncbi:DUF6376 family protein [Radiobacillus deserti]|uniref:Lipoprotein n=1 Tax=Radiobacillus deserti TaxID=2594883 RepID=A0A516KEN7_9BACI|nr:DUF6376 family protein [Radiobacillus deserti]QDP39871.1 hypothetical protein FN924_06655 [Radiobacillus deserti]
MKKQFTITSLCLATVFVLSGCSLFGEVENTMNYAEEAQDHIHTLANFAEEAPTMLSSAMEDPQMKEKLLNKLETLEADIKSFQNIEVPAVAESIHQQIEEKNSVLLEEIQTYTQQGELVIEDIQQSEMFTTIRDLQSLMTQIENLGL